VVKSTEQRWSERLQSCKVENMDLRRRLALYSSRIEQMKIEMRAAQLHVAMVQLSFEEAIEQRDALRKRLNLAV
jgi:hypothetical protein